MKKQMPSDIGNKIDVCPHCGIVNFTVPDAWINMMGSSDSILCSHCKEPLNTPYRQISPEEKAGGRGHGFRFWMIALILIGFLLFLSHITDVFKFKDNIGEIVYGIAIILVISSTLAYGKIREKMKYLMIWGGIFLVSMIGYAYRIELSAVKEKVLAEVMPSRGFQKQLNTISFPISSDGHFYIRAHVNGTPVRFLVDTGASHIVLSPEDARKTGFDPDNLKFDRFFETANGRVRGGSIRISDFKIKDFYFKEIGASVNGADMRESLLGMTFFKRLESYHVKDDILTLNWYKQ